MLAHALVLFGCCLVSMDSQPGIAGYRVFWSAQHIWMIVLWAGFTHLSPSFPNMAQWPCPRQLFFTQPGVDGGPPTERAHGCECLPVCRALAQPLPVFLSSASLGNFILQVPGRKTRQARVKRLSRGHTV